MPRLVLAAACALLCAAASQASAYQQKLVGLERRYTFWSFEQNPTSATDAGIHAYDDRLADYSASAQAAQMVRLRAYRNALAALEPPPDASPHARVDYLLIRANLEGDWWSRTVLRGLQRNPSIYEGECSNGIFSIVKRQYASDETRVRAAIARLRACPRVLDEGRANLTQTVREFAQIASEDIRDGDSLYTTTLDQVAHDVSPATRRELTRSSSGRAARAACLSLVARLANGKLPCRRFFGWAQGVRLVSAARLVAAVRFRASCRNRSSRARARSRFAKLGSGARCPGAIAVARADLRIEGSLPFVLRAELGKAHCIHQLPSHRHDPTVHRTVPYRRGSQSPGRNLSGRLHESARDVLERSSGLLFRTGFQCEQSNLLRGASPPVGAASTRARGNSGAFHAVHVCLSQSGFHSSRARRRRLLRRLGFLRRRDAHAGGTLCRRFRRAPPGASLDASSSDSNRRRRRFGEPGR